MNISHVLSLITPEASIENTMPKEKGSELQGEALLFSFLFRNILGLKQQAEEQKTEGHDDFEQNIIGQNMYWQTLQDIIPAGKDANSGLHGEQNQEGDFLSLLALSMLKTGIDEKSVLEALRNRPDILGGNDGHSILQQKNGLSILGEGLDDKKLAGQLSMMLDTQHNGMPTNKEKPIVDSVLPFKDIEFERIKSLISRETSSLSPAELDKYRNTLDLLKELYGQIRVTDNQKSVSLTEMAYKVSNFITQQQQSQGKSVTELVRTLESIVAPFLVKTGETSNTQILSQQNQQIVANIPSSEQDKQTEISQRLDQRNPGEERILSEGMIQKSSPQQSMPGQHPIFNMEGTPIADRTAVTTELIPMASARIWDQVMGLLKRQDYSQVKELTIQLHPAELGKVNFSVRMENGQVHLVINASDSSTANFLQNSLAELRNNLSQSGVDCGTLEMGYNHSEHNDSREEFNEQEDNALSRFTEEEKNYYPGFVSAMSTNGSGSRINVKA